MDWGGFYVSCVCVCVCVCVWDYLWGGKTHGDAEDKVMLEGLRALRRWRRALSWVEGSMVVVGPWSIFLYFCWGVGRSMMERA